MDLIAICEGLKGPEVYLIAICEGFKGPEVDLIAICEGFKGPSGQHPNMPPSHVPKTPARRDSAVC